VSADEESMKSLSARAVIFQLRRDPGQRRLKMVEKGQEHRNIKERESHVGERWNERAAF
jgi:hypothetical protein